MDTIKQCVFVVASFIALFSLQDFGRVTPSDRTFGPHLTAVYKDLERYETVARRREPYTPAMQLVAFQHGAKANAESPNGSIPTLVDGFGFGLQAGLRLTEWAQPAGVTNVSTPHLNNMHPPQVRTRALCPVDLRVATISK